MRIGVPTEVKNHEYRVALTPPGVHELVIEEMSAGLRPATPDNAPVLGPADELAGLHWATGHHRNGILLAPVTAELLADTIMGAAPAIELAPYDLRRFGTLA